jgi:exopolyphosphatase/guanosine-5'-triphosphate,3'-diphosphate pyrophosphatase
MHLGIVDCGTNTFNFIIVQTIDDGFKMIYNNKIPVKLGQGGIHKGFIEEAAFKRGIKALQVFSEEGKKYNVTSIKAFATAAIRDASNGIDFCAEAAKIENVQIEIIDGEREAELIFKGNSLAVGLGNHNSLIFDIGGGSNEYIIGNKDGILWKKSFRLGVARLLEEFNFSDPITDDERYQLIQYLNDELTELQQAIDKYKPTELIGSSGAFDSVIEILYSKTNNTAFIKDKTCFELELNDYRQISKEIMMSSFEERRRIKGLIEMRVDMIVVSCVLIDQILNFSKVLLIRVSCFSLKEGVVYEYLNGKK